jgi:catecholate siderophore receptor
MSHESNVAGRDKVNYDRWGVAPSLAFGLGTPTRVNLDYYHLESDDLPDSGIPYSSGSGRHRPRPTNQRRRRQQQLLRPEGPRLPQDPHRHRTIAIEHDLNDSLTIKNTLRHGTSMQDYILTQPDDSKGNVNNGSVWRRANTRVSTPDHHQPDRSVRRASRAGFKNSFSTGIEFTGEETRVNSYTVSPNTNPIAPWPRAAWAASAPR